MIIPASDEFVIKTFNSFKNDKVKELTKREFYDTSLYSMLEFISFDNHSEKFVLKSLKRTLKHEIPIHHFVNNYSINGANILASFSSDFYNLHFIIMEYINDLEPVYNYDDADLVDHYSELAKHLAFLHVNSSRNLKQLKDEVIEFSYLYYLDLLAKFAEKLPMLSKKINHELYLTEDIIDQFLNSLGNIRNVILKTNQLRRTLVHGDFDVGNIFFKPMQMGNSQNIKRQITAIDWGLSHIDFPIVDLANLLNSLKMISESDRNYILESYLKIGRKKFPKNFALENFETIGMILHHLFFIDFQLNTLETSSNNIEEYYEQIHRALESLIELSTKAI